MKTLTKIKKQIKKKTNSELVETILKAAKNEKWFRIAEIISGPRKKRISLNLDEINEDFNDGEAIVVPGKVLSQGELHKKIKIVALNFSENAKEKLSRGKKDFATIEEEIKKNPDAKNLKIITGVGK